VNLWCYDKEIDKCGYDREIGFGQLLKDEDEEKRHHWVLSQKWSNKESHNINIYNYLNFSMMWYFKAKKYCFPKNMSMGLLLGSTFVAFHALINTQNCLWVDVLCMIICIALHFLNDHKHLWVWQQSMFVMC